jgi:hypothetical protein
LLDRVDLASAEIGAIGDADADHPSRLRKKSIYLSQIWGMIPIA